MTYRYAVDQSDLLDFHAGTYANTTTAEKTTGDGTWYLHRAGPGRGRQRERSGTTVSAVLDNTAPPVVEIGLDPASAICQYGRYGSRSRQPKAFWNTA